MQKSSRRLVGARRRSLLLAVVGTVGTLWASAAMATITQGDFSVYGFFETREAGRWGEGSSSIDSTRPSWFIRPSPRPSRSPASLSG